MGERKYCDTNLRYLCECNNVTPKEVMASLDMSKLQFFSFGARAIKAISNYFNVLEKEFTYEDLRMPSKYRYLSVKSEKNKLIELLCDSLDEDICNWHTASDEVVQGLYGHDVYKQTSFQIEKEDYTFVIILNLSYDSVPDEECELFPLGCYAYGYIRFDVDFVRYFISLEDKEFKMLCDKLLQQKSITLEKWETRKQFQKERKTVISSESDATRSLEVGMQVITDEINFVKYFGKESCLEAGNEKRLKLCNSAINLIAQIKKQGCVERMLLFELCKEEKAFLDYLRVKIDGNSACVSSVVDRVEKEISQISENILRELKEQEEERKRRSKENVIRDALYQEMQAAKAHLGNWLPEDVRKFAESMHGITLEELLEQLQWISYMSYADEEEYADLSRDEKRVLANYIWAKRLYSFTLESDEEISDCRVEFCSDSMERVYELLKFIKAYKNKTISKYYGDLSEVYAEIIVYLFGIQSGGFAEIQKLQNYCVTYGMSNSLIRSLHESMYFINCISDEVTFARKDKCVNGSIIPELSQAQWTNFFEDTDDKVMYVACNDVYDEVSNLFTEYGIELDRFFKGRSCVKQVNLFSEGVRSGLAKFGKMIVLDWKGKELHRYGYRYFLSEGKIYSEGVFDTIELLDANNSFYPFPLIDKYLATSIWKYMENYLRILTKYKSKCTYKYGGYFCIDAFLENNKEKCKYKYWNSIQP